MTSTPATGPVPELPEQQRLKEREEAKAALGGMLLAPGQSPLDLGEDWDQVVLDFAPDFSTPGSWWVQAERWLGDQVRADPALLLGADSALVPVLEGLRRSQYTWIEGAFWDCTLILRAEGRPQPRYLVGLDTNSHQPPVIAASEDSLGASVLVQELERFPRKPENVPAWVLSLLGQDRPAPGQEATVAVPPPAAPQSEPLNAYLSRALQHFRAQPTEQTVAVVLSALTAGEVLLDISDSTLVPGPQGEPVGPESAVRVQTMKNSEGGRSLAVYSSAAAAERVYQQTGRQGQQILHAEPALRVLSNFVGDPSCTEIVVDPGSAHECHVDGRQIEWVMGTERNDLAKAALLAGSMEQLLGSFMGPNSQLIMGMVGEGSESRPVFAQPEAGQEESGTIILFTSAAEAAATDPSLRVRSLGALAALSFALDCGATAVQVNAVGPTALLPGDQVLSLVDLARSQGLMASAQD